MRVVEFASTSTRSTSPRRVSPRASTPRASRAFVFTARAPGRSSSSEKTRASPRSALECATNDDLGVRSIVSARPFGDDDAKNAAFEASTSDTWWSGEDEGGRARVRDEDFVRRRAVQRLSVSRRGRADDSAQLERALVKMTGKSRRNCVSRGWADGRRRARATGGALLRRRVARGRFASTSKGDERYVGEGYSSGGVLEAHPLFHSRFHAVRKAYRYSSTRTSATNPFRERTRIRWDGDRATWMYCDERASYSSERWITPHFVTHRGIRRRMKGKTRRGRFMALASSTTIHAGDGLIRLEVEGDGFLYRQVRNMVGAALVVASGNTTWSTCAPS